MFICQNYILLNWNSAVWPLQSITYINFFINVDLESFRWCKLNARKHFVFIAVSNPLNGFYTHPSIHPPTQNYTFFTAENFVSLYLIRKKIVIILKSRLSTQMHWWISNPTKINDGIWNPNSNRQWQIDSGTLITQAYSIRMR